MMQFFDRLDLAGVRETQQGYLTADARIARSGLYQYAGSEVGRPDLVTVTVYRPEDAVFDTASMMTWAHKPVTNDHPADLVTADTFRKVAVGWTAGDIARDGDFLRVPLMVADAAAIRDVRSGKRELSAGYTAEITFEPGWTPDGEYFQAKMSAIRADHVAIVAKGRAGSQVRLGDSAASAARPISDSAAAHEEMRRALSDAWKGVDSAPVAISDAATEYSVMRQRLSNAWSEGMKTVDDKAPVTANDTGRDWMEKRLQPKVSVVSRPASSPSPIPDSATPGVDPRRKLEAEARRISGMLDFDGMSDSQVRREAVRKRIGDQTIGQPDAFVDAAFKTLCDIPQELNDPMLRSMSAGSRA